VDVPFEVETDGVRQPYVFIDTAGIRKARRVVDAVEFFSVKRTEDSIGRSDISVLVLDAVSGILEQDKKIADIIVEKQRACIVVINKWDLVEENVRIAREAEMEVRKNKSRNRDDKRQPMTTLGEFGNWVQEKLFFLDYAPVVFTSAKDGFHLDRLLEAIRYVAAQLKQKIPTAVLNRTMQDAVEKRQPVSKQGHRLKLFYSTQVGGMSPTFLMFVNRSELLSDVYTKYISRELRRAFGYEGCPIILKSRARPKKVESIRERSTQNKAEARKKTENKRPEKPGRSAKKPVKRTGGRTVGKSPGKPLGKPARPVKGRATSGIRKRGR
jgi:GTP-binding protein